jgi:imidazolonepropionase-like amidohydrolase
VKDRFYIRQVYGSLLLLLLSSMQYVTAQSDPTGERRVTQTIAISNVTVTTAPGKSIRGVTVLINNGLIESIGTNLKLPPNTQVIKGDSLYVYPAFIDGASMAGVSKPAEPEKPAGFDPSNPSDELAGITPWKSVLEHFDIKKSDVTDMRKAGFALAQLVPDAGMISGKSALVVYGSKESSNVISNQTGIYARFRGARGMYPGTTLGVMAKFRDLYKNAELSSQHDRLFASNIGLNRPEYNKTLAALYPVIDKNVPVLFEVSNELEVRRALRLQNELGFKLVLVGVTEAAAIINEIKAANAHVLLSLKLPENKSGKEKGELNAEATARTERVKEAYLQLVQQAGLLEKAGIPFAFTTIGVKPADIHKNLRVMIENGLSEQAALAALTTQPAAMLGIQKFAGTLEKGKMANMVITTAPLFDKDSEVKMLVADGHVYQYEAKAKSTPKGDAGTVSIEGTWDYTSDTPAGSSSGTLTFEKSGETYKGAITYDDPAGNGKTSSPMNNITLSGSTLSFSFDVAAGGMSLVVTVSGEINEDRFDGSMSLAEYGSFPLNATKKPGQ